MSTVQVCAVSVGSLPSRTLQQEASQRVTPASPSGPPTVPMSGPTQSSSSSPPSVHPPNLKQTWGGGLAAAALGASRSCGLGTAFELPPSGKDPGSAFTIPQSGLRNPQLPARQLQALEKAWARVPAAARCRPQRAPSSPTAPTASLRVAMETGAGPAGRSPGNRSSLVLEGAVTVCALLGGGQQRGWGGGGRSGGFHGNMDALRPGVRQGGQPRGGAGAEPRKTLLPQQAKRRPESP